MDNSICQWFAYCTNPATETRPHPILGDVDVCERCGARIDRQDNTTRGTK